LVVQTIKAIDVRSGLFSLERILDMQLDPYLFVRESYRQRRLNLIYDGAPPLDDSLFDDEEFDDEDELDALLPTD
jgi:phospholipid-binding lipoprotein MlaA